MAAEKGFEPLRTDPESVVLPLHHSAANSSGNGPTTLFIIALCYCFVKYYFRFFSGNTGFIQISGRQSIQTRASRAEARACFHEPVDYRKSVIGFVNFKIRLGMGADGADFRSFSADYDVAAVPAFPYFNGALLEYFLHFDVL